MPSAPIATERLIDLTVDVPGRAPDRIGPRSAARLLLNVVPQGMPGTDGTAADTDTFSPAGR